LSTFEGFYVIVHNSQRLVSHCTGLYATSGVSRHFSRLGLGLVSTHVGLSCFWLNLTLPYLVLTLSNDGVFVSLSSVLILHITYTI